MKKQLTKNILSVKDFANVCKESKKELNSIFKSPFVVINLLNKVASGTLSKIEGCEISPENIKLVAKELKKMHGLRYPFDASILSKNANGKFCNNYVVKKCPKFGINITDVDTNGWHYQKEIVCTYTGIYNAFARLAKIENKEQNKTLKEQEKAEKANAKKREKIEKARKAIANAFGKDFINIMTDAEILEKYKIIKKIK